MTTLSRETDLLTPLMLACASGQVQNVKWLIEHGSFLDQQQNHSGNCPLFFALQGYRSNEEHCSNFMEILELLISNKANVAIHNRQDETFLHEAVTTLDSQDFASLIELIKTQSDTPFEKLFDYIDQNDHDVIFHCLEHRFFDQLFHLLQDYPNYFQENFVNATRVERNSRVNSLDKILETYSEAEQEALYDVLNASSADITNEDVAAILRLPDAHSGSLGL